MRLLIIGLLSFHAVSGLSQEMTPAPVVYFDIAGTDIAAKLQQIVERGGVVDAPRFEVPGVVILGLFKDPAGNPMALIEMKDGVVIVP